MQYLLNYRQLKNSDNLKYLYGFYIDYYKDLKQKIAISETLKKKFVKITFTIKQGKPYIKPSLNTVRM